VFFLLFVCSSRSRKYYLLFNAGFAVPNLSYRIYHAGFAVPDLPFAKNLMYWHRFDFKF